MDVVLRAMDFGVVETRSLDAHAGRPRADTPCAIAFIDYESNPDRAQRLAHAMRAAWGTDLRLCLVAASYAAAVRAVVRFARIDTVMLKPITIPRIADAVITSSVLRNEG